MGAGRYAAKVLGPAALQRAPGLAANFIKQAFDRAVDGVGPMPGAAAAADAKLERFDGDRARAIREVVDSHVTMAGAQGFVTNIGGLVTMAVAIPANVSGLALLQAHMVAGIAHLRGYDLADPRVRNAVLACMLGGDGVSSLIKSKKLPSSPMAIATAPAHDPALDQRIASEVATELFARVAGKRTLATIGRKMPIVGGGFGMVSDGFATYQVGRYAARELKARSGTS
ncbi:MAG: EcsC family protein [Nocardioidaceae bacterium]